MLDRTFRKRRNASVSEAESWNVGADPGYVCSLKNQLKRLSARGLPGLMFVLNQIYGDQITEKARDPKQIS
jgi:hypothetical protein